MQDMAPKRYTQRPLWYRLLNNLITLTVLSWAAIISLFAFGFWLTSATVSDEEIRPTSRYADHSDGAKKGNP
jgi:hypothetical protein